MQTNGNSFAEKLNQLFEEKRKADGTRWARKEVLERIPALTRIYLWRLQAGKVARPAYEIVTALAELFGVPPSYFFEEENEGSQANTENPTEELRVVLRSFGLDRDAQKAVILMVEQLKKSKPKS